MPQQNIPWWLQYQMQQQGGQMGTWADYGRQVIDNTATDTPNIPNLPEPMPTPDLPPESTPTGGPVNLWSGGDPSATPTPQFQQMTSAGPGLDFFPAETPAPTNPAPSDTGVTPQQPSYFPPDNPPDFSNLPTNPPTNETDTWTPPDTYLGGGINPPPDVPMIASPNDAFFPPDLPPNFSNIPDNIPPNESMIAQPVPPDTTQSGLSLSGMPDLSIAGDNTVPVNNYYPDGSGGYVVYDQNWNVVTNMPGTGDTPTTFATGSGPQSDPSGAGLATNTLGFPDQQSPVETGGSTDTGGSVLGSDFTISNELGFDPSQPQGSTPTQSDQSFATGPFPTFYNSSGNLGGGGGNTGSFAGALGAGFLQHIQKFGPTQADYAAAFPSEIQAWIKSSGGQVPTYEQWAAAYQQPLNIPNMSSSVGDGTSPGVGAIHTGGHFGAQ